MLGRSAKKLPRRMNFGLLLPDGVKVMVSVLQVRVGVFIQSRPSSCSTLARRGMYSGMFLAEMVT